MNAEEFGTWKEIHINWGLFLDLPCAWTLQLFPPGKKQGCDSLWFRNIYVKWYNLTEVSQSLGEDRKQVSSRLLIHCNPKQVAPILPDYLRWRNGNYSHLPSSI